MARLVTREKEKPLVPTPSEVASAVAGVTKIRGGAWTKWTPEEVLAKISNIPENADGDVLKYIKETLPELKKIAPKAIGVTPSEYIIQSIETAISDGAVEYTSSEGELEYELVPVTQGEVKKALKVLLSTQSDIIAQLYTKHTEINAGTFNNKLADPLITIEKMINRTLANYTYGKNNLPIENHIRFNSTFIALNSPSADNDITTLDRIYLTLTHEMIHQWQDQVLYAKAGQTVFQEIEIPSKDVDGNLVFIPGVQKKRPREWHNADFRMVAAVAGIPCEGKHCSTGKCNMPPSVSYNRKFRCMCIASNGYPMTIWSTRYVTAVCTTCKFPYKEVIKDGREGVGGAAVGGTIDVSKSHVELPNEDGVEIAMKEKFSALERFKSKALKDAFVDVELLKDNPEAQYESGVYQKNHNAYTWGYRYWVAYNSTNMAEEIDKHEVEKVEPVIENTGTKRGKKNPKPTIVEGETPPVKKLGKILKFPPSEVDAPKEREYSVESPLDIIDLYKELGSIKAVGAKLGVSQAVVSGRVKKFGINFNDGTYINSI